MKTDSIDTYRIKVLDVNYKSDFDLLDFQYIHYKIEAKSKDEAFKKAKTLYLKGEEGERIEELPFLWKIFSSD